MATENKIVRVKFSLGDLVHHKLFDYRGVIVDVDQNFQGTDDWYQTVAKSRPPRDKPWYHVLVHQSGSSTYVAERNLSPDPSSEPISHPMIEHFFSGFDKGKYISSEPVN